MLLCIVLSTSYWGNIRLWPKQGLFCQESAARLRHWHHGMTATVHQRRILRRNSRVWRTRALHQYIRQCLKNYEISETRALLTQGCPSLAGPGQPPAKPVRVTIGQWAAAAGQPGLRLPAVPGCPSRPRPGPGRSPGLSRHRALAAAGSDPPGRALTEPRRAPG